MKTTFEFPAYVECPECYERFDEQDVEYLGIKEDWRGRDIVTFECPNCGKIVESFRYG